MTFLTFAIEKCETLKFWICSKEAKILQSSFESTESETKSLQSTSKFHESLELYHWNFMKFHEMSLVSWNLVNYCKITQFLVKFCKSLKDFRKILLKWLGKTVKYCINFIKFHSCTEKWLKVGQLSSITLTKVHAIPRRFSMS